MDIQQLSFLRQRNVEQFFAASIFIRPLETVEQCGWLQPSDLLHEGIREYWRLVSNRITPGMDAQQASETSVQAAFEAGVQLDVMTWANDLPYQDVPQAYAAEISRRQYLAGIATLMGQLAVAVGAQDDQKTREIVGEMNDKRRAGSANTPVSFDVANHFDEIVRRGSRSIDTFIPPLDTALGGLERQTLTVLAGRPGMGKTALAWQIARNVAQSGRGVTFFSLEMSAASLWARAICPLQNTTWRDVRAGRVVQTEIDSMLSTSYQLAAEYGDKLRIIDTPQTTESVWRITAELKPDLVVVDHLRLLKDNW